MKSMNRFILGLFAVLAVNCQYLPGHAEGRSMLDQLLLFGAGGSAQVTPVGGGTLRSPTMSLIVPQGAIEENTTITYTQISVPEGRDGIVPLQAAYEFGPGKLQFNKPATLTICYDASDVRSRGLQEKTMQIQYLNRETGEFVSMGGEVDAANHCVSAPVYHFSAYILTAQLLAVGNNPPTIGGATFFPGTPIAGLPVTVRSSITDWDAGSAIANARFYYRTAGSGGAFKSIAMLPEANDGSGQFYGAKIPAADVLAAGFEYYIQAFDTLNAGAYRPVGAPGAFTTIPGDVRDATTPIRFQTTVTQMTAGFSRDLTVQVKGNSAPTFFPVRAETLAFAGGKGTTSRPTWLSARYTAQVIGSSFLQAAYGDLNVSQPLAVYPGMLNRIVVLYNDAVLPDPFEVNGASVTQLDAAGYDAFDNFMFVQPAFGVTNAIGTFGDPANYGKFTAVNTFPDKNGTITATIGGYTISYNVVVHHIFVFCLFDGGLFDSSCIFND